MSVPPFYALCRGFCWLVFRGARRLRVIGAENVPATGPVLLACNHVSNLDPPVLGCALPRRVRYMAKVELFAVPVLGPLITALGTYPVDRSRGDVAAIKRSLEVLRAGEVIGIFPEGGRNTAGDKKPQSGIAFLASRSGATVVPAYVAGTRKPNRTARITVVYGAPMRFEGGGKASRAELAKWTDELMSRIYALRETIGGN